VNKKSKKKEMAAPGPTSATQEQLPLSSARDILQPLWQLTSLQSSRELALRAKEERGNSRPGKVHVDPSGSGSKQILPSMSVGRKTGEYLKRSLPSLHTEQTKVVDEQLSPAKHEHRLGWSRVASDSPGIRKLRDLPGIDPKVGGMKVPIVGSDSSLAASVERYRGFIQVLQKHEDDKDLTWLRYAIDDL